MIHRQASCVRPARTLGRDNHHAQEHVYFGTVDRTRPLRRSSVGSLTTNSCEGCRGRAPYRQDNGGSPHRMAFWALFRFTANVPSAATQLHGRRRFPQTFPDNPRIAGPSASSTRSRFCSTKTGTSRINENLDIRARIRLDALPRLDRLARLTTLQDAVSRAGTRR